MKNSRRAVGRKIIARPSKAQNINVIRGVSRRCVAVSLPLPVKLSHTSRLSLTMRSVSMPFGDTLTQPSRAAVATKNIGWRLMNVLSRLFSFFAVAITWRSDFASQACNLTLLTRVCQQGEVE